MSLDEQWHVDPHCTSSAIHDMNGWVGLPGLFGDSYRRMGHWRLTFQFAFADLLGYKYLWQLDDDSFFRSQVQFNMMSYMSEHDLWLAGFRTLIDPPMVTQGLPEITRLFLVSERLTPTGPLFYNHTAPPGLDGLFTADNYTMQHATSLNGVSRGGWSRTVIYGNCIIIDMDKFWWPAHAQKFLELVLQTGYYFRFRWNEQGVIAMMWQMFVPEQHYNLDSLPIDYFHPRKRWGNCTE